MDVWEVPRSSRSGLDRGFLMDVGPKHTAGLSLCRRARSSARAGIPFAIIEMRILARMVLSRGDTGPSASIEEFGRRESLGQSLLKRARVGLRVAAEATPLAFTPPGAAPSSVLPRPGGSRRCGSS